MLKGIPEILSPELLKVLCEMGHSDRLVIADGNFPVMSMGKNAQIIRMDGHGVPEILDAILRVFPLDTYIEKPVNLMEVMPGDNVQTPIWDVYKKQSKNMMSAGKRHRRNRAIQILRRDKDGVCCYSYKRKGSLCQYNAPKGRCLIK